MNYYIRSFHFKKCFFSKKTIIYFEYYLGDKWRKGKLPYLSSDTNLPTIGLVSSQIISFIQSFIASKHNFWTPNQIANMIQLTEQFNREEISKATKLFK